MSVEGVAALVTAERIQAASTTIPLFLLAFWLIRIQMMLWRRTIWNQVGAEIQQVATRMGANVLPVRSGWQIRGPGRTVFWRRGLWGYRTIVWGTESYSVNHLALAAEVCTPPVTTTD